MYCLKSDQSDKETHKFFTWKFEYCKYEKYIWKHIEEHSDNDTI